MQFSFDSNTLTDLDRAVLALVLGDVPTKAAKDEPKAPAAPKAAPAKKAAAKPEPTPEPEPVDDEPVAAEDDDLMGDDEGVVTRDEVVAMASALLSRGGSADLKKALTEVGARRVSEIADADLGRFAKLLG